MRDDGILRVERLGFPWQTQDPFLFCVHHDDAYPAGTEAMGPAAALLRGRNLGNDFEGVDGWRMYHGEVVPGFPQHPHRGFETVTVARRGFIDHSDSLGATARFGRGDAQWMTAGKGVVHSEMFPLLDREGPNPVELFQIWLNLPRADKMAEPHFAMLWSDDIPVVTATDAEGRRTRVTLIAGPLGTATPPAPPPRSWAARADSDVAIWTIALEPGARWTLPPARPGTNRTLYVMGCAVAIGGRTVAAGHLAAVRADRALELAADKEAELLLLQGKPIGEPVVQHGPFVMNAPLEIMETIDHYRRTGFGGWRWPSDAPVHPRERGRFARHADGREEEPRGRE